jgi:hypothetical protein
MMNKMGRTELKYNNFLANQIPGGIVIPAILNFFTKFITLMEEMKVFGL